MRNCFELLLVAVIGALLSVMLAGAIDTASAKRAFCEKNLKKLYIACAEYEEDHGVLPPVIVKSKPKWRFWNYFMAPYIKAESDLACPADARNENFFSGSSSPLAPAMGRGANSYGLNYFLTASFAGKKGKSAKLENLSRPGRTLVFGDCRGRYMYPDRYWKEERSAWHENESVMLIHADGHVVNLTQSDMGKADATGKFRYDLTRWMWI